MRWGGWIVLVSTILIVASGVVTCAMRRTLVSRKARKKRIAQNAEMNGENFYNRQQVPMGARAETPPPLVSQPTSSMVNGAPGSDRLPTFPTYEKNPHDFEEDRIPLNTRTPSNRTVPHSRPSEEGYEMQGQPIRGGMLRGGPRGLRGGRGGHNGPRDEYGYPLPPSSAFGPMPGGAREPRMRGPHIDDGFRGRGRGNFPARGYGRGGPDGPGRGAFGHGRGMPIGVAVGAGANSMASDMRNRGNEKPGQYEPVGPAAYGRSPSAPAYGRRSPGPPTAPYYERRPSPGPPSHPGGGQPSPGGRSAPGGYGRQQSPGPPRTPGDYGRQRSNSNPRTYDYQSSPGGYQGQVMRADSPPPPVPGIPANETLIGQAIEMDATTGSPSHTPAPIRPMQLRDSDSDVQGLIGLQQQREHRESSVYSSSQEPYIPPRSAWSNPTTGPNNNNNLSHSLVSPIPDSPIAELPAQTFQSPQVPQLTSTAPDSNSPITIPGHTRYNSADNYYEDVDPRFAEPPNHHDARLPAGLTAGLHPQAPQHGIIDNANGYDNGHLQPSHSYDSIPDDAGARSPAISDGGSNYTSISQRGINPQWQPPPDHMMGMGGPNRKPARNQQSQRNVLLNHNPDFELPIQGGRGAGARLRSASRGQREPGMIPGMDTPAGQRYPGNAF
ncbi:MAG: hypothetical protein Q9169_003919 [Polycauliona sp. 2 TL-2023]